MGALVDRVAQAIGDLGGRIELDSPCQTIERDGDGWRIDGHYSDAVVLACPAAQAARLLSRVSTAAGPLGQIEYADVVLVTVAVPARDWPDRLHGSSGYLVPKPVQQTVTAVSFASQKWAHLRSDDQVVLRISLGRDGLPVLHLSDQQLVDTALAEVSRQLDVALQPTAVRVTTWQRAFPQYRPHHERLVAAIEADLSPTLTIAGASYHGIGIPACIASGQRAAAAIGQAALSALP
jgi:oxygen-dependent protoporphyrinogen oxidase